jgi:hypothetical protein
VIEEDLNKKKDTRVITFGLIQRFKNRVEINGIGMFINILSLMI